MPTFTLLCSRLYLSCLLSSACWLSAMAEESPPIHGQAWTMQVIDNSSQGADGVKRADFNGDGLDDIATGWEEGGVTRIYIHPGLAQVRAPWPMIEVGSTPDVEDALLVDLDGDGIMEVVACLEGEAKQVRVFRRGAKSAGGTWSATDFPALTGRQWMFARAGDIDGRHGIDLIIGAKNRKAELGWLESPADPSDLAAWRWHPLTKAAWIMSIWLRDVDGDGDLDILYSDRMGEHAGIWWLERPAEVHGPWPRHAIWRGETEILSFGLGDIDGDGHEDLTAALDNGQILWLRRLGEANAWQPIFIPVTGAVGDMRDAVPGDIDGDGHMDIAVTTWNADGLHGVLWLKNDGSPLDGGWSQQAISGDQRGIKFDHLLLLDMDGDGDLDLLTCEEHETNGGLGVIWYENPFGARQ